MHYACFPKQRDHRQRSNKSNLLVRSLCNTSEHRKHCHLAAETEQRPCFYSHRLGRKHQKQLIISLVTVFGRKGVLKVSLREYTPLVICQIISIFVCIVFLELVAVASKVLLILMAVSVVGVLFINVVFFST